MIQWYLRISVKMKNNQFGEIILDETDLCDLVMQGRDVTSIPYITVDSSVSIERLVQHVNDPGSMVTWTVPETVDMSVQEFDARRQSQWFMPAEYQQLDIAEHVLGLCQTPEQLQRVGQELLMYESHDLLDLLRYLK